MRESKNHQMQSIPARQCTATTSFLSFISLLLRNNEVNKEALVNLDAICKIHFKEINDLPKKVFIIVHLLV